MLLGVLGVLLSTITPAHAELLDSPAPENFLRRIQVRAAVVGNHVYIDGGELSQLDSATKSPPPSSRASNGNNSTLSIDLSKSKSPPAKMLLAKAPTPSTPNVSGPRPTSGIWKFVVDGNGGGKWEIETPVPTSPAPLRTLRLTEQAAFVATTGSNGGIGFSVDGIASAWTDPSNPYAEHIPGMVVYDMNRKEWRNETSLGFTTGNGSLRGGAGVFVPSFGNTGEDDKNNGLVFILGGSVFAVPATTTGTQPDFVMGFENVTFFDPVSREWYWQTTTGERPSSREKFCAVGVQGRNGTYEIFIYGGADSKTEESYRDVYILSLPGFVWFKAADSSQEKRADPACVVVGKGKRQMLSIGGKEISAKWESADSFPQGLGIFDMTALTWLKDGSYDADMGDYESPDVVRDWYNKADPTTPSTSTSSTSGSGDTQTGGKKSNNTGAIAGGVVAGVVGLAILGGLLFCFLRKSKQNRTAPEADNEYGVSRGEGGQQHIRAFPPANKELVAVEKPVEAHVAPEELPTDNNHHWERGGTETQVGGVERHRYR
ncbi:hypothetical protein QBC32DRAFT_378245 [Pseudoneurospora amorphoporcata]|uniref:Kelch repeat protein n=1 Tax=Pseudoneurospora amorphoporcata TaxID=241081 RepID=A0AAN6NPD9_9PEZI|nr:hypothetical protein QBC32DRAFT_378245 [Pseudoneurospora amorphoporcata]